MNVIYSDKAKQWTEGYALLQQATKRLEEVVGKSADSVKAEWDCERNGKGQPLCTLRLTDSTGTVSTSFSGVELKIPVAMRLGVSQLWGDLLEIHSDLQHQKVQDMLAALEQQEIEGGKDDQHRAYP